MPGLVDYGFFLPHGAAHPGQTHAPSMRSCRVTTLSRNFVCLVGVDPERLMIQIKVGCEEPETVLKETLNPSRWTVGGRAGQST